MRGGASALAFLLALVMVPSVIIPAGPVQAQAGSLEIVFPKDGTWEDEWVFVAGFVHEGDEEFPFVEVSIGSVVETAIIGPDGHWSMAYHADHVSEGGRTILVTATSLNNTTLSATRAFFLDKTDPSLDVLQPQPDTVYLDGVAIATVPVRGASAIIGPFEARAKANDTDSGMRHVRFCYSTAWVDPMCTLDIEAPYTSDFWETLTAHIRHRGPIVLEVIAADVAGNEAVVERLVVKV